MRKIILTILLLASSNAWATCSVINVIIPKNQGGAYATSTPPSIAFYGPGVGGASATANMAYKNSIWYVSSVIVTTAGSYTGTVTVTFSGGNPITGDDATGYAVLSGACGVISGSGLVFSWLL